jgi:hypothetical protein
MGLAALVCRETMEDASRDERAAEMHALILRWIERSGALKGLDSSEISILTAPLGKLERSQRALAFWRLEHLTALAWALGKVPAAQSWERLAARWVARRVGFLRQDADLIVKNATIRPPAELAMYAVYLEESRETLEKALKESPGERDTKTALVTATHRREAIAWLLGEQALALEAPLLT